MQGRKFGIEEVFKRDFSRGIFRFEEGHRAHVDDGEAAGTRVFRFVFSGGGGAGEDKLTREVRLVDDVAHGVPNFGEVLPFVDQARFFAVENEIKLAFGHFQDTEIVGVFEFEDGFGKLFCGAGFTTPFAAFDTNSANIFKALSDFRVDEAREIWVGSHGVLSSFIHKVIVAQNEGFFKSNFVFS